MAGMKSLALALALVGVTSSAAAAPLATRAIPKLDGIVVDADGADWGTRGLAIDAFVPVGDALPAPKSVAASARIGWDDGGLVQNGTGCGALVRIRTLMLTST
jgi:hypothetical protein